MAYYWTESGASRFGGTRDGSVQPRFFDPRIGRPLLSEAIEQGLVYQRDATEAAAAEQSEEAAEMAAARRDQLIRGQVRSAFAGTDNNSFLAQAFGAGPRRSDLGGQNTVSSMVAQFMGNA